MSTRLPIQIYRKSEQVRQSYLPQMHFHDEAISDFWQLTTCYLNNFGAENHFSILVIIFITTVPWQSFNLMLFPQVKIYINLGEFSGGRQEAGSKIRAPPRKEIKTTNHLEFPNSLK